MPEHLKKALQTLVSAGFQVSPEAWSLIASRENPIDAAQQVVEFFNSLSEKPPVIEKEHVEQALVKKTQAIHITPKTVEKPIAAEIDAAITVHSSPPRNLKISGGSEAFKAYFTDRFRRLTKILRGRLDAKDAILVSEAIRLSESRVKQSIKVIGMVSSKRELRSGSIAIELEDLQSIITVVFPGSNADLLAKASKLVLDQVVCIVGIKRGGVLIAQDIILPDLPSKRPRTSSEEIYVALISDLHIGSKLFLEERFRFFIKWLKGEHGASMHRELASKVKYLVIAGDLVDGIGVYPGQEDELALKDVYKQYEYAARLLSEIPDYIQIIIIPGNHDAAFPAIPSPPIFKEYAEPVYELPNVLMLGDPSHISLHEVEFLITHGRSLDDAIPSFPGCSFSHPEDAMVELLKCRHLAPIYGQKTPLAPVPRDYLVVERIPDVFQAGHVHMMGAKVYKGILVVNTGTWQSQTSYQRSMGLEPKPAIATLVNLVSLQPVFMEF